MDARWVSLTLDVTKFDASALTDVVQRCLRRGITFTTIAALGDDEANRRRPFALNRTCSADIPERGEFYTYAEDRAERIEVDTYNPSTNCDLARRRRVGRDVALPTTETRVASSMR